jgi:HK97 family phage portal protein
MRIPFTNLHVGSMPREALEGKASTVAPLIYLMYQGQIKGVWTKRNFAQYSDDAYKRCAVAFKAIGEVSRGAAKIPWVAVRGADSRGEGGTPLAPEHPLNKLLRKPNPWQSEASWREAVIAYLMLSGNSYIEGVGPDNAPPRELWTLRPDRTRVMPGKLGPAGYVYHVNGQDKTFEINPLDGSGPILHMKFFNPLDDWYGMSPIEAAATSVDAFNMAGEWNQALLQNGCKPSGALVYKPGESSPPNLSEKQREALKEELNAAQSGTRNAGRPLLLEGGLEWQQMSLSPSEMDWINGKHVSAREICMVLGVPPQILGIPGDNTYSNYQEARQALYQDTIIPLNDNLLDGLNAWLAPAFGEDVTIVQDISKLPALAPMREKIWTTVTAATWMTINEKRKATGFEEVEQEEADEIFIPSTLVPLMGAMDAPEGDEGLGLDEEGNPIEEDPNAKPGAGKPPFGKPKPGAKPPAKPTEKE